MRKALINLSLFKAGWLACVLLAAAGAPQWGVLAVAAVVLLHLVRVSVPAKEALFLAAAGLLGLAWESLVLSTGLLSYPTTNDPGGWAPYWIVAIWVLFATTIGHGFSWIKRNWIIGAAMGLFGGPLAFLSGAAAGAVVFTDTPAALALIAVGWAVLLPVLALISDTLIDSAFLEPRPGHSMQAMSAPAVKRGPQNA